ncbi:MAG: asparagine synthetase B, partial [Thaumarchaeota archaeon]
YLARSIYELAYSMSLEIKLRKVNGKIVRKWVLRKAAERLGVPVEIVQRSKKAAQYSSGIQKKLKKLLSRAGDRLDR